MANGTVDRGGGAAYFSSTGHAPGRGNLHLGIASIILVRGCVCRGIFLVGNCVGGAPLESWARAV